jgi:hypothetical protein
VGVDILSARGKLIDRTSLRQAPTEFSRRNEANEAQSQVDSGKFIQSARARQEKKPNLFGNEERVHDDVGFSACARASVQVSDAVRAVMHQSG